MEETAWVKPTPSCLYSHTCICHQGGCRSLKSTQGYLNTSMTNTWKWLINCTVWRVFQTGDTGDRGHKCVLEVLSGITTWFIAVLEDNWSYSSSSLVQQCLLLPYRHSWEQSVRCGGRWRRGRWNWWTGVAVRRWYGRTGGDVLLQSGLCQLLAGWQVLRRGLQCPVVRLRRGRLWPR